jgi:hypothetical protein
MGKLRFSEVLLHAMFESSRRFELSVLIQCKSHDDFHELEPNELFLRDKSALDLLASYSEYLEIKLVCLAKSVC